MPTLDFQATRVSQHHGDSQSTDLVKTMEGSSARLFLISTKTALIRMTRHEIDSATPMASPQAWSTALESHAFLGSAKQCTSVLLVALHKTIATMTFTGLDSCERCGVAMSALPLIKPLPAFSDPSWPGLYSRCGSRCIEKNTGVPTAGHLTTVSS